MARLVDARRLARRADEPAREEIRQRRVVLPERDDAAQQIGAAQERAVGRRRPAEGQVVAAAGARVRAVEMERLGAEARRAGVGVHAGGDVDQLRPRRGRVDVDLEDARVGGDRERDEPRIDRAAGTPRARSAGRARRPRRSTTPTRSTVCSTLGIGGRNTKSLPSRPRRTARRGTSPVRPPCLGTASRAPRSASGLRTATARVGRRRRSPGERVERQARAHRRVAGDQREVAAAQRPVRRRPPRPFARARHRAPGAAGSPNRRARRGPARRARRSRRGARRTEASDGVGRIDVDRGRIARRAVAPPSADDRADLRTPGCSTRPASRARPRSMRASVAASRGRRAVVDLRCRARTRSSASSDAVVPQRLAVGAPQQRDLPARERFARIPLALPVVNEAAGREPFDAGAARAPRPVPACRGRPRPSSTRRPPCRRRRRTSARRRA